MQLDRTNRRILDLLQDDARMTIAELSRIVNRAESTVRERVAALEQRGFIRAYRAEVDPAHVGLAAHAILRASCELGRVKQVTAHLGSIPEVTRVLVTSGPRPLHVEILTTDLASLEQLLERRFADLGLFDMDIEVVVRVPMEHRPVRLDPAFREPVVHLRPPSRGERPFEDLEPARA